MTPHNPGLSLTRFALALVVAIGLAPLLPTARAQTDTDGVFHSPQRTFLIPFTTDKNDARLKTVILHVSDDQGRNYNRAMNLPAPGPKSKDGSGQFRYTAPRDGNFWFVVQTQDNDGTLRPPNLNTVQPGLKVCVDTEPPQATLSPVLQPKDAPVGVVWSIQDDNLKLNSLRLEYRVLPRTDWIELPVLKVIQGEHDWNPGTTSEIEVRLSVQDRAGNETVKTTRLTPGGGGGTGTGGTTTPGTGGKPNVPAYEPLQHGRVQMVNKRRIQLNYEIANKGPSGVATVEVWYTYDTKTWNLYSKNAPETSPFVVEMEKEGRYGFTLVAKSGVNLSDPAPKAGDEPQLWVEVDETPPAVRLLSVEVGPAADDRTMKIMWNATDKFMAAQPITISYAASTESSKPVDEWTWTPLAPGIANDGKYTWKIPENVPYQMYIRVEASDQAGNVGKAQTAQPVKVDLNRPKVTIIEAKPADK